MALHLALDDSASLFASWCDDASHDGSAEERAFVEVLLAAGDFAEATPSSVDGGIDGCRVVGALEGPASASELAVLASVRPEALSSPADALAHVARLDRVAALTASLRHDALVGVAGVESSGQLLSEVHVETEVASSRRTSRYAAGRAIENARALATAFPGFASALRDGELSEAHCSVLVERTRAVSDPALLVEIERRALRKALRLTPGELGRELAAIVAAVDPDAASRARRARDTRRVWTRPLDDGLAFLGLVHDASTVAAIKDAVTADALGLRAERRADCAGARPSAEADADRAWDDASLDALRSDALAARVLGKVADDGSVTWDRSEATVVVNVVIDLDTLRTEQEQLDEEPAVALLDGEPVPASLARELAESATWWRRFVTDPVEGHLLDYGDSTYLPSRLRRFVLARDGVCRAPGCTNRATSRLQMDHAVPFPDGASSAANCGALCTTCHQLKTAGDVDVVDSRPDGSATWVTAWGQRITLPPRPVLPGGRDPDPSPPDSPPSPSPSSPPF